MPLSMLPSAVRRLGAAVAAALALCVAAGAQESPTLRKIRDAGVITVGYRADSMPFAYLDARRRPIGYSVELCRHIVDAVQQRLQGEEIEVRWMVVSSATRLPLLANGTIDLECGVTTHTEERARSVGFSVTTFVAASRLLSRRDTPVQSLEDLAGKSVVSTVSTTSIQYLTAMNRSRRLDMKVLAGFDDMEAFQMLRAGRAAAFAMDDVLLRRLVAGQPDEQDYLVSTTALTTEPYAIGLPHGDAVFKRLVDDTLIRLFTSGGIGPIYQRWFERPVPPRNAILRLPMSAQMKRVFAQPTDSADPAAYR